MRQLLLRNLKKRETDTRSQSNHRRCDIGMAPTGVTGSNFPPVRFRSATVSMMDNTQRTKRRRKKRRYLYNIFLFPPLPSLSFQRPYKKSLADFIECRFQT